MALRLAFVDVGQGDGIVVLLPDHRSALLIDSPPGSAITDFLEVHHIEYLPLVLITHMHYDHIGGVLDAIMRFPGRVGRLLCNFDRTMPNEPTSKQKWRTTMADLVQWGLDNPDRFEAAQSPRTLDFPDCRLDVLFPAHADVGAAVTRQRVNLASVVTRLESHGHAVLLSGDLEPDAWATLWRRAPALRAQVLKFPHHGARYEPPRGDAPPDLGQLLEAVDPEVVIISVGTTNTDHHPNAETVRSIALHNASTRILCTQATRQCAGAGLLPRDGVLAILPPAARHGESQSQEAACPCAGTVVVELSEDGIRVTPESDEHERIRGFFATPLCRRPAR